MTELKFCKDCRYCSPDTTSGGASFQFAQCDHPNADDSFDDLVSGRRVDGRQYCCNQRGSGLDRHCGEEGKNFEAAS